MNIFTNNELDPIIIIVYILWVLPWKAYGLWLAAKNNQKGWFIALIIFNTFGILEIIYIFAVLKKKFKEVKNTFLHFIGIKKNKNTQ